MRFSTIAAAALAAGVSAQRPSSTPICDYYTTALLKNNTAANQYTLLTLLVNTVVIGNYTQPNKNAVPGILAPGTGNYTGVNLLPYFNGQLASSNRGGSEGVSVNFLDGGGAAPLEKNMPANSTTSNQYGLLTHLYQFFGSLLGCSMQGMPGFSAYVGEASMYEVHKFMDLDYAQMGWFIENVALAAESFGVATSDVEAVGKALTTLFDYRCAPNVTVIPAQGAQQQAICIAPDCPLSPNATCSSYQNVSMPMNATTTMTSGTATATMTSMTSTPTQGGAMNVGISFGAVVAGLALAL